MKMKNNSTILWILLALLTFCYGCEKDNIAKFESTGVLDYPVDESSPSHAKLKEWREKYNTTILYKDLHERDFVWDFETKKLIGMVTTDVSEEVLPSAISFFEKHIFAYYPQSFLKEYFPLRLALADSCYMFMDQFNLKVPHASVQTAGTMLMANINEPFTMLSDNTLQQQARTFNNEFFKYMYRRIEKDLPEFFQMVDYSYSRPADAKDPQPKELGFWAFRSVRFAPLAIDDFAIWMTEIASTPPEKMDARFYFTRETNSEPQLEYSPMMKKRYDLLSNYFKSIGLDIHELRGLYQ
ncbi:hypothetical protein ORI89_08960 [Sphingobacterium sp. UT-1RO-CII-1]|uniref:hypothetical protein n=1 Tax=Sphingobacterium sp. UT-1RO-CII-1 TaxID=2995225 RepID=UPI00227A811B|nr:hypothetical protein [Sphingobacterium sp. UT-1RO-CII-1]MCY4779781.1 hypothetical protein [Sphingobacterium sp. UT-1RO-CII-1]